MAGRPANPNETRGADPLPWYKKGLRFQCTQCGNCCSGAPGFVWVSEEEIEQLARVVYGRPGQAAGEEDIIAFERKYVRKVGVRKSLKEIAQSNYDCVFLDSQKRICTVYEARPAQCRTWPFWNSNLESCDSWEEAKQECPGCGKGKLYQLEEIEESRHRIDV